MRKRQKNARDPFPWDKLVLVAVYLFSFGLLVTFVPGNILLLPNEEELQVGKVFPRRIVSDREYRVLDQENTQRRIEARLQLVRPVYRIQENVFDRALSDFDAAADLLRSLKSRSEKTEVAFWELESLFPRRFSRNLVGQALAKPDLERYLKAERDTLATILERGVLEYDGRSMPPQGIEVRTRRGEAEVRTVVSREEIIFRNREGVDGLASALLAVNTVYDPLSTQAARDHAKETTQPIYRIVREGEVLLDSGEIVTEDKRAKILSLSRELGAHAWGKTLSIAVVLAMVIGFWLLYRERMPTPVIGSHAFLGLSAVGWGLILLDAVLMGIFLPPWVTALLSPVGLMVLFIALLSDSLTGAVFALLATLPLVLFESPANWADFGLPAALTSFFVAGVRSRFDLFRVGLLFGLLNGTFRVLASTWHSSGLDNVLTLGVLGAVNGLLIGVICLGLLPPLEILLNLPTRFRLQELGDLNSPILKRMSLQASGTYTHSVNVAQLSENAAQAIGADPLLARVGSIYHDIGKIDQAEYFVENQRGYNKHDDLKPIMSAAILKSHVRNGLEKAKELGLPQKVMDIIQQHHGNGLIEYFYDKAVKLENREVSKEEYRYPGPNPRFKESAIVMLADTVEAATRTLKNPNLGSLERFIGDLVQKKINEELLNDCGLSLHEIQVIKDCLVRTMEGQLHSRIEYPEGSNGN